jgi:hypothetical protein
VIKPVYIKPDTSKVDWQALSVKEPDNPISASQDNGWLVWPQPASPGRELVFRSLALYHNLKAIQNIEVSFYDCQGKKVVSTNAISQGNRQWAVPNLSITVPGLYLAVLMNSYSGSEIGSLKVVVK